MPNVLIVNRLFIIFYLCIIYVFMCVFYSHMIKPTVLFVFTFLFIIYLLPLIINCVAVG